MLGEILGEFGELYESLASRWASLVGFWTILPRVEQFWQVFLRIRKLGEQPGKLDDRLDNLGEQLGNLGERLCKLGERLCKLGERLGRLGERLDRLGKQLLLG